MEQQLEGLAGKPDALREPRPHRQAQASLPELIGILAVEQLALEPRHIAGEELDALGERVARFAGTRTALALDPFELLHVRETGVQPTDLLVQRGQQSVCLVEIR